MRKLKLLFALFLSLIATNVMGETLITPENFSTLQAGTYVSLQCRDTYAGAGWYLNGASAKSTTFSYANIYLLVAKDGGLALKNVKTGYFVGNSDNLVSDVEEANSVSFEIKNKGIEGTNLEILNWTTQQEGNVVDNTCRFIVKGTSNFLNTNDRNGTPKYANGRGGYSIWYVYTYTPEEVIALSVEPGIYRIKNEYNGRGELVYNEEYANVVLNNITLGSYSVNNAAPTGNGTYWYVRPYKGKLYIYNVEANKFLQNSSDATGFSANVNDQCAFTIDRQTESDVEYIRVISPADANKFLSTSCGFEPGPNQVKFRSHEAAADYLSFIKDEGEDMEKYAEEVAAANNLIESLVDVTYNYVFGGDIMKTETFTVSIGNARPAATVPYACEANLESVPEIITEAGTYDIPVTTTTAFPFAFSADHASAAWYTIKMRRGYAGCNGTNFPETDLGSQPTDAKYLFAFQGNPFAFKVLLPNEKYMINYGANNELSTFGDEGTEFSIVACNDQVTFTIDGVTGTINDVQTNIGFWKNKASYTDTGSKMLIENVADITVYNIVFNEDAPKAGGITFNEVTYSVGSAFNAFSSSTELNAKDFTAIKVSGYNSEVTISGRTITVTYIDISYDISITDQNGETAETELIEGDSFSLSDNIKSIEITKSIPNVNITYTRNFTSSTAGKWQAWFMPFDVDYSKMSTKYDVAQIYGVLMSNTGSVYVAFQQMDNGVVKANIPYVIRAKVSGDIVINTTSTLQETSEATSFIMQSAYNNFEFGGVYENSYLSAEYPTYAMGKNGNFAMMGTSVYLRPFRIYMRIIDRNDNPYAAITSPQEVKVVVLGDEETEIIDVDADIDANGEIFNLAGLKTQKLQKGINIVNGKKVLF